MGFDPVDGIGSGCLPGMVAMRAYIFDRFGGRDLGCFNPASTAGGGPSLHAAGRASDFGFNAYDAYVERPAGDELFVWAVRNHDALGLQEILWRGAIWYWPRRDTEHGWGDFDLPGVYGPVQQTDHMSHVHLGVDLDAARHWTPDRLTGDEPPMTLEELDRILNEGARRIAGQNLDGTYTTNRQVIDVLLRIEKLLAQPPTLAPGPAVDLDALAAVLAPKILDAAATRLAH